MKNDVTHAESVLISFSIGIVVGWLGFIWKLGLLW